MVLKLLDINEYFRRKKMKKKVIKLKDVFEADTDDLGAVLIANRFDNKKGVGMQCYFWTSMNNVELSALAQAVMARANTFQHIICALHENKFDKGCGLCKIAKKLKKVIKKKKASYLKRLVFLKTT